MKKTTLVLGVVVLVSAGYAGTSWYVGKQAQTTISRAVTQTNERAVKMLGPDLNSSHFNIEIRDYTRGVFSSSAQYVIHTLDADGKPLEYVLQDHMQHGPFPFEALRAGKFEPMLAYSQADMVVTPAVQEWFDAQQGQTPLTIETQVGFGGQGTSNWTFAPLEMTREQHRVSFSGGSLNVVFSGDFGNNVVTAHFDVYTLTDNASGEKVEVRDISLHSITNVMADQHVDHRSTAQVKSVAVGDAPDTSPIEISDLEMELTSTQKDGFLDAKLRYDIAQIVIEGEDLGKMSVAGAIAQLNLDASYDLQAAYAAMAQERGPETEPGFLLTHDEQLILQEKMRPILAAAPSVSIEPLVLENSSGKSRASAFVALRDPGELGSANAVQLLQQMIANAKLELVLDRSMIVELFQKMGAGKENDRTQAGEFGGQLFDEYGDLLTQLGIMQRQDNTLTLTLDATPSEDRIVLNGEAMTTEQVMVLALGLMFM